MVMMLVQIQPGLINFYKNLMLYYSSHIRVFNGEAFVKEKLLLLKIFNKYSIKSFLTLIKIINFKFYSKFNIDFYVLLKELIRKFLLDLSLFLKKENLKIFFFKKLLIFFFLRFFSQFKKLFNIQEKIVIFRNLEFEKVMKDRNQILSKKRLSTEFRYSNYKIHNLFLKSFFFLPRKSFLKEIEKTHVKSVFVSGQVFNFYRGSLTPFYKQKFSWLLSSG